MATLLSQYLCLHLRFDAFCSNLDTEFVGGTLDQCFGLLDLPSLAMNFRLQVNLKLPVVVVVFVDASLALIELKQRKAGQRNLGVDFGATDFPAVARALGGNGVAVETRAALNKAVLEGLAAETFTVVAAKIGPKAYDGRF